jgi:glycine hydroxymethyltransferase
MSNDRNIYKKINSGVFPGTQGGPLMHVIAAKAVAFKEAYSKEFIFYQKKLLKNSKIFSLLMIKKNFEIISGITDNHLFLLNLHNKNTTGKKVEDNLYQCNIIVNKNMVPNDKKNASLTSGIRIGSPSITSRGFKSNEILIISNWICDIIDNYDNNILLKKIKIEVKKMCKLFPIYK